MKLIHLSDLHIGKVVNGFSMLEDQMDILIKILRIIDDEKPDGVIIAGDVYDKNTPSADAVQVFDDFLYKLSQRDLTIFIISGNHDSPERLSFGSRIMNHSGIHLSRTYGRESKKIEPITMEDEYGKLDVFLLPFIRPAVVKSCFPEEAIKTYTDAIRTAINNMLVDTSRRNIIIAHQFIIGATPCDSEEILSVGGTDGVEASVFDKFDYVALGHLHNPQSVVRETIRYCGTPLKYSFSEINHRKSVTVIELQNKGDLIEIREIPLIPKRDMREIRGEYNTLASKSFYEGTNLDDYLHVILTDETDVKDALRLLSTIYKKIMKLEYDNSRTKASLTLPEHTPEKDPRDVVSDFFKSQNGKEMSEEQREFVSNLVIEIWRNNE